MGVTVPGAATEAGLSKGPYRAPRGMEISCKGWQQEAALRMLLNNLDPEVAEKPEDLVVYGGTGKAARNWECFHAIVRSLKALEADETLLVQSGKPVAVFRTHDRGKLDLHRYAGSFAGNVRDVCGGGEETFWRRFEGETRGHRRNGWHGRSTTASGHDE